MKFQWWSWRNWVTSCRTVRACRRARVQRNMETSLGTLLIPHVVVVAGTSVVKEVVVMVVEAV